MGWYLAKSQGLSILAKIQSEMAAGRVPTAELVDGLLVLIGGIVLLTPGLLTDLVGFALMVPGIRAILREREGEVRLADRQLQNAPARRSEP